MLMISIFSLIAIPVVVTSCGASKGGSTGQSGGNKGKTGGDNDKNDNDRKGGGGDNDNDGR